MSHPLIDVCLVLLIFFILTITYASLERSIDIQPGNPDQQGPGKVDFKKIRDQVFVVTAKLEGEGDANASASSPVVSDASGHQRLIEDFLRAIETGSRPACDGHEGGRASDRHQVPGRGLEPHVEQEEHGPQLG